MVDITAVRMERVKKDKEGRIRGESKEKRGISG